MRWGIDSGFRGRTSGDTRHRASQAQDSCACSRLLLAQTRRLQVRVHSEEQRREFWDRKFAQNVERDRRQRQELAGLGWKVVVVWECETCDVSWLRRRLTSGGGSGPGASGRRRCWFEGPCGAPRPRRHGGRVNGKTAED